MGIRGLAACIHSCCPDSAQPPDWRALRGHTVGVDVLCFVHRGREGGTRPLLTLARQVAAFRRLRITPLFVFDGRAPPEKGGGVPAVAEEAVASVGAAPRGATPHRRGGGGGATILSPSERDEVKRFLYAAGCLFVQAVGEADAVLAHFARSGEISAVLSGDMDMLARGVPLLLAPHAPGRAAFHQQQRGGGPHHTEQKPTHRAGPGTPDPGAPRGWCAYSLPRICVGLRLSQPAFLNLCVLAGSDYTAGVPPVPWEAALVLARRCPDLRAAWGALRATKQMPYADAPTEVALPFLERAEALLSGCEETRESLLREPQWAKVARGEPPLEPQELLALWCHALAGDAGGEQLLHELLQGPTTTTSPSS